MLLLVALTVIFALLGRWQLHRADERRAVLEQIEAGRASAPITLATGTPSGELTAWRPAQAQGRWLGSLSVLLDNRNHEGRAGYWLATPLLLAPEGRRAVLVLRGWLPRQPGVTAPALPAAASGVQSVAGELTPRVPRMFELGSAPVLPARLPLPAGVPVVQNLDLDDYARAAGLTLLPVVLMQSDSQADPSLGVDAPADGLVRDWPGPSVDFQQNLGYAAQWFAFAAIAAFAGFAVAWRAWGVRPPVGR